MEILLLCLFAHPGCMNKWVRILVNRPIQTIHFNSSWPQFPHCKIIRFTSLTFDISWFWLKNRIVANDVSQLLTNVNSSQLFWSRWLCWIWKHKSQLACFCDYDHLSSEFVLALLEAADRTSTWEPCYQEMEPLASKLHGTQGAHVLEPN